MDEQFSKITVKVNGKEKGFEEEKQGEFPWVLAPKGKKEKVERPKVIHLDSYVQHEQKSAFWERIRLPKALVGTMIALVIGGGMGYGLLSLVEKNHDTVKVTTGTPLAVAPTEAVTIRPLQFYALQGGVFSKEDSALGAKKNLENQGIPATVLQQDDKYFILLGIYGDKVESGGYAEVLKAKGIDTYGKLFLVNGGKLKGAEGVAVSSSRDFLEKIIAGKSKESELTPLLQQASTSKGLKTYYDSGARYLQAAKGRDVEKMHEELLALVGTYSTYTKTE